MGYKQVVAAIAISLSLSACSLGATLFDPQGLSIGARALGRGETTAAFSEGGDAIFGNPAGLGECDTFNLTSMSGKALEEINYYVLGGVYPLGQRSAFGLGYTGSFVQGIELRDTDGILSGKADLGNNLLTAAYGRKLSDKTSLGASLKYFFVTATQNNSGNGCGWSLDLGLLQKESGGLSLGLVGKNILSSAGVQYQNAAGDQLPQTILAGSKLYLLGSGYGAAFYAPLELNAAADLEIGRSNSERVGLEFSPSPLLTLRGGWSRNNISAGLSLFLLGAGFHCAYLPANDAANYYFSLSLDERGWPPEESPDFFIGKK